MAWNNESIVGLAYTYDFASADCAVEGWDCSWFLVVEIRETKKKEKTDNPEESGNWCSNGGDDWHG